TIGQRPHACWIADAPARPASRMRILPRSKLDLHQVSSRRTPYSTLQQFRMRESAMPMNVKSIPTLDPRINEIRELTARIVNKEILPNERKLGAGWRHGATPDD